MPKSYDNTTQFKNYNHSLKVPFVIYADFECMLQKFKHDNLVMKRLIAMYIKSMFLTALSIMSSVLIKTISRLLNIQERTRLKYSIKN